MQKKTCLHCEQPIFSKKLCKFHHKLEFPHKYQIKKSSSFRKKAGTIKPISDKRKERLEKYYELRELYLISHPICQVCGKNIATDIHHMSGRLGEALFNDFLAVDRSCHSWIETHPIEAKELGYSKNRL